jgi:hypothetical protein
MGRKRKVHFHAHIHQCICGPLVRILCINSPTTALMTDVADDVTCEKCAGYLKSPEWLRRLFGPR